MNFRPTESLPPEYFARKYAEKLDYWNFNTSRYEAEKYEHTLRALPRAHYRRGFEIGCSIGVLTERLAKRCGSWLSVDVSAQALDAARARCPDVCFEEMRFPRERPEGGRFDLIVVSEVGYYWSLDDLAKAEGLIEEMLEPEGDLILVHWTSAETDYPLTGDQVHESFRLRACGISAANERRSTASTYSAAQWQLSRNPLRPPDWIPLRSRSPGRPKPKRRRNSSR